MEKCVFNVDYQLSPHAKKHITNINNKQLECNEYDCILD
jgi:hypothetical protein